MSTAANESYLLMKYIYKTIIISAIVVAIMISIDIQSMKTMSIIKDAFGSSYVIGSNKI
jgi:hypothetical protein